MTANLAWYLVEHASIEYNDSGPEPSDLHQPTPSYAYYTKTKQADRPQGFAVLARRRPVASDHLSFSCWADQRADNVGNLLHLAQNNSRRQWGRAIWPEMTIR